MPRNGIVNSVKTYSKCVVALQAVQIDIYNGVVEVLISKVLWLVPSGIIHDGVRYLELMVLWRMSSADIVDGKIWFLVLEAVLRVVPFAIEDDVVNRLKSVRFSFGVLISALLSNFRAVPLI